MKNKILIVDDETDMLFLLERILSTQKDYEITKASTGAEALEMLTSRDIDVILTDMKMPEMDGMQLLEEIRERWPDKTAIIMTAYGSIENAVEAMKKGAYDYITKPFQYDDLLAVVQRSFERVQLLREREYLQHELQRRDGFNDLIGESSEMRKVCEMIRHVSVASVPVFISGESGTGKELVARAIHTSGERKEKRFVALNCSAIPETLLESELFGFVKGAFSGATRDKKGLFQYADGGTLFLDEIADASLPVQAKLLRALQEQKIRPLGAEREVSVDVRLLFATNRDLKELIGENRFREDLYYRINVISVHLPPLRERKEDIPLLIEHFMKGRKKIHPDVLKVFTQYGWPGNVRELKNVIERLVLFTRGDTITADDIPSEITLASVLEEEGLSYGESKKRMIDEFNRAIIVRHLTKNHGNATKAAEELKIERTNFQRLMRKYGVSAREFKDND